MVNFVEQATLIVKDRATKDIRKINKELGRLYKTADKLRRIPIQVTGLGAANREVGRLHRTLRSLPRSKSINVRVSTNGSTADIRRGLGKASFKVPVMPTVTKASVDAFARELRTMLAGRRFTVKVEPRVGSVNDQVRGAVQRTRVRVDTGDMGRVLRNSWAHLGMTIEQAVIRGFQRGASQQDIAETRLDLQDLTPAERAQAQAAAANIAEGAPTFSRGEALNLASELLPVLRNATEAEVTELGRQVTLFARLQQSLGVSREEAVDNALELAKAGEQAGAFTDAQGNVDLRATEEFFMLMRQGFVQLGREATPELIRGLFKSLRTAKFSLNEQGVLTALLLAEEQGTTAGVGLNQLIKQLSGERVTDRARANLVDLGLVTTKEVVTGTEGGRPVTETVVDITVDEDVLRQSPLQWVRDHLIPAMREQGLDPTNAVDATTFAGQITSDRTATESLVALILRNEELLKSVQLAQRRDLSDEAIESATAGSLLVAINEVQAQFVSILGEVSNSVESILLPVINSVAGGLQGLANFLGGEDGEGSLARTGAVVGGGVAAAGLGLASGRRLLRMFSPLNASATALTGSATNLNAAAIALQRAAGAQAVGDIGGGRSRGRFGRLKGLLSGLVFSPAAVGVTAAVTPTALGDGTIEAENLDLDLTGTDINAQLQAEARANQPEFFAQIERKAAEAEAERNRRISHFLGVMERNADRIANPDNSAKADLNLLQQQGRLAEQLVELGAGKEDIVAALTSEGVTGDQLRMAFEEGATGLASVVPELADAGGQFGDNAGQGLLALAPQIGQAIGEATLSILGELNIDVGGNLPPQQPRLDTGPALPF